VAAKSGADPSPSSDIARRRKQRHAAGGRRSDSRWQDVLTAAATVFRRVGYGPATLEDIAQEVGINRATLYYYVGTKEELLVALLQPPIAVVRERLDEIAARPLPAPEKLAEALREYVLVMQERPELFIFLGENVHREMSGPEAETIRRDADRYGRVMAQIIATGAQAGEFRDDIEPQVAVMGILGMFNWMHRWYRPEGPRSLTALGDDLVKLALASLSPDAAGSPIPGQS
jgi:AcrR family transcriptional regulator